MMAMQVLATVLCLVAAASWMLLLGRMFAAWNPILGWYSTAPWCARVLLAAGWAVLGFMIYLAWT